MMSRPALTVGRRRVLVTAAAGLAALTLPGGVKLALAAAPTDRRFVLVILRGALDGLAAVPPYGDPDYAELRGPLAFASPGAPEGALDLDGHFGLNPALTPLMALWQSRELAILHAVATPYRDRSHFDGQNLLENGTARPNGARDGWLNRALGVIGGADRRLGLAVNETVPLVLEGPVPVASWEPAGLLPEADPDFLARLAALYRRDPILGPAFAAGIDAQHLSDEIVSASATGGGTTDAGMMTVAAGTGTTPDANMQNQGAGRSHLGPAEVLVPAADGAGKLLADPRGPRVAVLEAIGWDTHANQGLLAGRLATALKDLADALVALKTGLGPAWNETVVVVATEFGRTAAPNGTGGTDHGTAGVAFLLGGRVAGGRVIADWPGLARNRLYQGRDLAPTADLRGPLKAALAAQFGLPTDALDRVVFPDSAAVRPPDGLIRT